MYVEGVLVAVPLVKKAEYAVSAAQMAQVFKAHGATRVVECWGDDVPVGEVTSFPMALKLEEGEVAVFSWIEFPDKATRDACMEASMTDPRMPSDITDMPFDGKRMIFGGFSAILDQ